MTLVDSEQVEPRNYLGGLAFLGLLEGREAYELPFPIPLNSSCIDSFEKLANNLGGNLEFDPNLSIFLPEQNLPLLEVCDGQTVSHVLIAQNCDSKAYLLRYCFEALVYSHVH